MHFSIVNEQMVARLATANATTDGEMKIARLLTEKLNPTYLEVRDVSGKQYRRAHLTL